MHSWRSPPSPMNLVTSLWLATHCNSILDLNNALSEEAVLLQLQNAFQKYMWYNMAKLSVEIWTLSQEENEYLYFLSSQLILSSASHYDLCSFFPRLKLCPAEGNNWPIWPTAAAAAAAAAAAGNTLHTGENKDTLVLPVSPHCPPALITLTSNPHWSKCKTYNWDKLCK